MATPRNNTFAVASGGGVFAGRQNLLPAWLTAAAPELNEWVEITGTSNWIGQPVNPWMGWAVRNGELWSMCSGGHGDGNDNSVVMCDLMADAPVPVQRASASATGDKLPDAPYYADGKPASRHIYHHNVWVPQRNRLMMFGCRAPWPTGGANFPTVDGFNPDTNTWDAERTWDDLSIAVNGGCVDPATGNVWLTAGRKWTQSTQVLSNPGGGASFSRWPMAFDTLRNQRFALQWGDGQGFDSGVNADVIDELTNTRRAITFNSSGALDQFIADQATYAGMDYDEGNDRFLFYPGSSFAGAVRTDVPNRIYVITPNSGTTWDMSFLTIASGSATPPGPPPPPSGAGINGRFKYIPALRGFALLPRDGANIYFLRTS